MKCPVCGAADLIHETRDISCAYGGKSMLIRNVCGDFCPICGEGVLDQQTGDAYSHQVRLFLQKFNLPMYDGQGGLKAHIDPCSNKSMLAAAEEREST